MRREAKASLKMAQMAWTSNSLQCNAPFVVAFAWQVKREKPQGKPTEEKCITKSSSLRYDFDKCNREPRTTPVYA